MKINFTNVFLRKREKLLQFIMRIFLLLFFTTAFSFNSENVNSQNAKIKIEADMTISVHKIFEIIQQQVGYKFIYSDELINNFNKVNLKKGIITAKKLLEKGLTPIGCVFEFTENETVIVKRGSLIIAQNNDAKNNLQLSITGNIRDGSGQPLPGANIIVKGTTNGTQSDFDGNFSITVENTNAILVISYLGFLTKEISVAGQTKITVVLKEDAAGLDEVVLVGYGKQSRAKITGAIASMNSSDLESFPSSSIEQSMAGKLAGVQLTESSGQPGAGISVRVRGISSISGGNEPLYVIDGIPFFNSDVRGLNGISSINPNDIESIQVLKDASATAIYGSRGANGVVMVTTKSSIVYNAWVSSKSVREKLNLMSGNEFLDYQSTFYENSGLSLPNEIAQIQNANTDWQDEVFQTSLASNHDLSISGGSEKTQYYFSLGYLNDNGIVKNSSFERISLRANLKSELSDRVSINTSISGSNSVQNGFSAAQNNNTFSLITSGVGSVILALPTEPVFDSNGNYSMIFPYDFAGQLENPVAYVEEATDKTTVNRFLANVTVKGEIIEGLFNNTRLGVDYQNRRSDIYFPTIFELVLGGNGAAILDTNEKLNYVLENYLEYKFQAFEGFDIEAILGASLQKETNKSTFLQSTGFFSDELENNAIQAGASFSTPLTNNIDQSIASLFSRVNLSYKDKYLFGASVRRDGASVFSASNKVATFPALSAGWVLSKEDFLANNPTISSLKVRASWGESGNPGIQPYQSLPLGTIVTTSQGAGNGLATGLIPNLPNTSLTWETTAQTNIGIDLGLLDSRISMSLDYYVKDTKDALAAVQLPPSGGFSTIIDNVGEVQNKGVELVLSGEIIDTDDLKLSMSFNISKNTNEVTKTKNNQDIVSELSFGQTANADGGVASVVRVGEQLGAFLGFNFIGFDASGIPEYEDLDNSGTIGAEDMSIIGSPIPEVLYGLNTSLSYKNFSFSMDWQGQGKVDVLNIGLLNLTAPENNYNRASNIYDFYPNPGQNLLHRVSNRYVEDASYLRLRNIRVGYNIPISSSIIDNINFYLSGQNLITITDYSGFDPNVNSLSGNGIIQGVDLGAYPSSKTFTLGMNVQF